MCRFCAQHGDGKRWYLEASNYAHDLERDLERRDFMLRFVQDFNTGSAEGEKWLKRMRALPAPLRRLASSATSRRMRAIHYGQPLPIEDCEKVFDIATSIVRVPCVCRDYSNKGATDEGWCIAVSTRPIDRLLGEAFERDFGAGPDVARLQRMTKDEAMALLRRAEQRGLMHSIWTFMTPFIGAICNCDLESGCMAMKITLGYETPLMWRGENVAGVDAEKCSGCRDCQDICPFEALDLDDTGAARVSVRDCWGCGICRACCASDAISLSDRRLVPEAASLW